MKQIYTGYKWRPMTLDEIEIMDATKVRPFKPKNPKAGDICDLTVCFYREGWEKKNSSIRQLAPFIFENMNFKERAELTGVMRRAFIRISEEYVNKAKESEI